MIRRVVVVLVMLVATPAFADWFDDYNAGIAAAKKQNWDVVIQKMTSAIKGKAEEGRVKPYGAIFIEYHPYYYRGIAYFEKGQYENAIKDLRKTKGPGELKLADAGGLVDRAERKIAEATTTTQTVATQTVPTTTTVATTTTRTETTGPTADPAVRASARQLLAQARTKAGEADSAKAGTYAAATLRAGHDKLSEANRRASESETTADWLAVRDAADRALNSFEAAISEAQIAINRERDKPATGTADALADLRRQVKDALEDYFEGDFPTAARKLDRIVKGDQRDNAMLWAFLGAAHFYNYYLDGNNNDQARIKARDAFLRAKRINPKLRLNEEYFQTRVRKFYSNLSG